MKATEKRLAELDPAFKMRLESQHVSAQAKQAADEEIASFIDDINKTDKKLTSQKATVEDADGKENRNSNLSSQIEDFEKIKMAENERLKGNESMKCKEFQDAIQCYTKALEYHSQDSATYSNRALAYLKTKEYARALEDAEAAIKLKPDYLKAYHRRGKAYFSLNKLELAIRDFQYILEKEPNNKEAITEIKNARKKLEDKLGSVKSDPKPT